MKKIALLLAVMISMSGCANTRITPKTSVDIGSLEKKYQEKVLLIIDNDLQNYVYTGKSTIGTMWANATFDIEIGKILTDTSYRQIKELAPNATMSDRSMEGKYDLTVRLKVKKIEFGVSDDGNVAVKAGFLGPVGMAFADVETKLILTMTAEISVPRSNANVIDIVGEGSHKTGFYSVRNNTLAEDVEKAVLDFSKKLAMQVESDITREQKTN